MDEPFMFYPLLEGTGWRVTFSFDIIGFIKKYGISRYKKPKPESAT